jgi:hypothetical protein
VSAVSGQDPRLGVEELKQLGVLVIESFLGSGKVSPDLLDPAMDRRTWEFALIVPFDIWIEELARKISQLALRNAPVRSLNLHTGSPFQSVVSRRTNSTFSSDIAYFRVASGCLAGKLLDPAT